MTITIGACRQRESKFYTTLNESVIAHKVNISENELIILIQNKDKNGMGALYNNYSAVIYGVIVRIVKRETIAEEVTNDCFLKIWNKIDQYDATKGKLFTWMVNIARNLALDKLRSSEAIKSLKTDDITELKRDSASDYPNIDGIGLKEIVLKLSADEKQIIDLMYFEGYSQSEISENFNIPLGTVKTRARAAINKLRTFF